MKFLLIEDNPIWQTKLEMILMELQFNEFEICDNLDSAQQYLSHQIPDLIIADIMLGDRIIFDLFKDGKYKSIPCLFITSHEDTELYELSKAVPESTFLIKPFHKLTVLSAIENTLQHHNKSLTKFTPGIYVKGQYGEKIFLKTEQVVYIKSELNYCLIKTKQNQFILKISLIQLKETLGPDILQIHKTYLVNKQYISNVFIQKMELHTVCGPLPIGRLFKPHILHYMSENVKI